jgi:hypothetical protein
MECYVMCCFLIYRFLFYNNDYSQQMQHQGLSWYFTRRRNFGAIYQWFFPSARRVQSPNYVCFLVGKIMGETYYSTDSKRMFTCLTGECASSIMECDGRDSTSPATFAKINLNTKSNGFDYFRVSVVNGYNLPMMVQPQVGGGSGDCLMTSCMLHLN